jgi:hypothetical protein
MRERSTSENYQIAPMNLKVGVLNNMDFQLVLMPYQWEHTPHAFRMIPQRTATSLVEWIQNRRSMIWPGA